MTTLNNDWFDSAFAGASVMAILRGLGPERTVELANVAWSVGIELVEVTVQTAADAVALTECVAAGREAGKLVGAGTIVSPHSVDVAAQSGAAFTVSPGFDPAVVQASVAAGLPTIPGVATASEVQAAEQLGLTWVKAFPAAVLTPAWFKTMRGPFPSMRFVATGGIDAHNAPQFLQAGARIAGVGSALEDEAQLPLLAQLRP